jgi:hypothetical protein
MSTQQIHLVPICPGLPLMPIASDEESLRASKTGSGDGRDRQGRGNDNAPEITQEAT